MKTINYSRQRQAIVDFLCSRRDHPTADVIYRNVRETYPKISLGTVYRNLNLLADMGTIRKVKGLNDSEHFDADTSDHQHFICSQCGEVEDIFLNDTAFIDDLTSRAAASTGFDGHITGNDIYFLGICRNCNQKNQNVVE